MKKIKSYLNLDYINKHKLSEKKLKDNGIELQKPDEIFVQYPRWNDYYGSNYGRLLSLKGEEIRICTPYPTGAKTEKGQYNSYKLCKVVRGNIKTLEITAHRLIADIFLPNFWKWMDRNQLQAHHLDHSRTNNQIDNLMLLPSNLHAYMNRIKATALFKNGRFFTINPYEIMESTGLSLEQIIGITNKKNKPLKSSGKWTVFEVEGVLIGFQFTKKSKKSKKKNKKKR